MSMKKRIEPTAEQRYEHYQRAKSIADMEKPHLSEAYRYVIPERNNFFDQSMHRKPEQEIFDSTAPSANIDFANNLQRLLMPPYTRWIEYNVGESIEDNENMSEEDKKQIKESVQKQTRALFRILDSSNFHHVINTVFQDMGVSTGVIIINERDDKNHPIQFQVAPMNNVVFDVGIDGELQNFWITRKLKAKQIMEYWPKAELNAELSNKVMNSPNEEFEFIEGCVYIYENEDSHKYLYYVQRMDGRTDILKEFRAFSPFHGFRLNVAPDEIYGRGPGRVFLPDIRMVNKLRESTARIIDYVAFPIFLRENSGVIDLQSTQNIQSGAVIDIETSLGSSRDPIRQLPIQINESLLEGSIESDRALIRSGFNSNPLPEVPTTPNQSATEVSIRQQEWTRRSSASIIRVINTLFTLVDKITQILRRRGDIKDIAYQDNMITFELGNKNIKLDYQSPILSIQKRDDMERFETYLNFILRYYTQAGIVAGVKIPESLKWSAEKLDVDQLLVNDFDEVQKRIGQMYNQAQQEQAAQFQPQVQSNQGENSQIL